MNGVLGQETGTTLVEACGADPSYSCEKVFEWTDSEFLAIAAEWVLDRPIRIGFILMAAWIIARILQRAVVRFTKTIANPEESSTLEKLRERGPGRLLIEETAHKRAEARPETIALVLRSIVTAVVWSIAALLVLGQLNIDLAPLIAGAGIGGIALAFLTAGTQLLFFSQEVGCFCKHDGAKCLVGNRCAGSKAAAACGNLDNTIGARLSECLERTIDGGNGGDIDGRVCVATLLGGIEHGGVLFRCCYWHDDGRLPQSVGTGKTSRRACDLLCLT